MDVDRVLDDVVREVIGLPERHAALDAAAGEPEGEGRATRFHERPGDLQGSATSQWGAGEGLSNLHIWFLFGR